ncbi:hypothetical protein [Siphonobacter sp. SORGH_AS_0500]|uniref:hypothetical protein n=1 Tax=Siphonobacter sp. SORGH_AS_0500 TaxID=1864824 RepID=UPI00285EC42A|nr:hypothetical protein [Siphonobacter sp. SORGH_AS_0500]MDR6195469.1 hypothetical protein [Siphonobacter sp. SORGH_AS_0500]
MMDNIILVIILALPIIMNVKGYYHLRLGRYYYGDNFSKIFFVPFTNPFFWIKAAMPFAITPRSNLKDELILVNRVNALVYLFWIDLLLLLLTAIIYQIIS